MRVPKGFSWGFILMWGVLQGCSAFPQLVRHTDPLTSDEHLRLGAAYEAQGLTEDAAKQYEAAWQLQKNNGPALIALGNLAFKSGDLKTAESRYRQVLQLDPHHAGANNNLAMIYLSRGNDLKTAEQFALSALTQGGSLKPYVLETLADIYIQQERYAEARKSLDEADAVAPSDNKPLREQLAKTREKLHRQSGTNEREAL